MFLFTHWHCCRCVFSYVLSDFLSDCVPCCPLQAQARTREPLPPASRQKRDRPQDIEKKFYRNFTDYIVETVKLLHISDAEIKRRMQFENIELIDRLYRRRPQRGNIFFSLRQLGMGDFDDSSRTPRR